MCVTSVAEEDRWAVHQNSSFFPENDVVLKSAQNFYAGNFRRIDRKIRRSGS
jgi:hypothetical protein